MRAARSSAIGAFAFLLGVSAAIAFGACHPPEQPPLPPPTPTNPTVEAANDLDASIVSDATPGLDVGSVGVDASPLREPQPARQP